MSDIICITSRKLCKEDFLQRIEKIAKAHPAAIVLREKDMSVDEYRSLAQSVAEICKNHNTRCFFHTFADVAKDMGAHAIHLPLPILKSLTEIERKYFTMLGSSCHSVEDAVLAEKLGCTYITAGHIFETDCKKGVPARGIEFLREICKSVSIPVYAIGGIDKNNYMYAINAGAKGVCVMSGAMTCPDPKIYFNEFKA